MNVNFYFAFNLIVEINIKKYFENCYRKPIPYISIVVFSKVIFYHAFFLLQRKICMMQDFQMDLLNVFLMVMKGTFQMLGLMEMNKSFLVELSKQQKCCLIMDKLKMNCQIIGLLMCLVIFFLFLFRFDAKKGLINFQ